MNKTKKNGFQKVACTMMAVMMMATCVVSGTLAKYASSATLDSTSVTAAKWSIKVGNDTNNDIAKEDFNMSDLDWEIEAIEAGTENNAVQDGLIAPGTWGYAAITVKNESEVDAKITVTGVTGENLTPTGTIDSPTLKFKCVAMTGDTPPTSYDAATNSSGNLETGVTLAKGGSASTTIYICYYWEYDSASGANDENDVKDAGETFTFDSLEIKAEQVKPEKNS